MSGGNFWDGAWKGGLLGLGMGATYGFGRGLYNNYRMRHSPAPTVTSPDLGPVERPEHIYPDPARSSSPNNFQNNPSRTPLPDNVNLGSNEFMGKPVIHGNSLESQRPTWGYKLYSNDGRFLKNGITSQPIPQSRYLKSFMDDK